MTAARRSGSGAERDRVVATLRRELLVPFDDEVAASHLEAMLLEFDWKLDPEPVAETATRRPMLHVRAVVASCMAAAALTVTGGFAAAGALPAPAQHWLSRTTRIVGIRLPDAPAHSPVPPPVAPPKIRTHPITTPPVEPLLPEPKPGPAARPAGRGIATTPSSTPRPRSGPAVEPNAASPSALAPGTADEPGNAKSSEAKAMNNAGGNGNDNSVGNGNGSGKSTRASSAATGGASKGKATAPVPAKRSPK